MDDSLIKYFSDKSRELNILADDIKVIAKSLESDEEEEISTKSLRPSVVFKTSWDRMTEKANNADLDPETAKKVEFITDQINHIFKD